MKLVLIITDYGSFNNFLAEQALKMLEDKHEVYLITSGEKIINRADKYDFKAKGIKIINVDFPRNFNPYLHFKASKKIKNILKKINPDLVHVHFTTGIFTTVFSGKPIYPTIGTFHGLGYPVLKGLKKIIFQLVEEYCFKRLDQIWLLNKMDYDLIKKKYDNKTFIYSSEGLGCDLDIFKPNNFDDLFKKALRKELGIKEEDFVFAYIGRYVNFKGYHLTIESFLNLSKKFSNIKLITMGGKDPIHPTGLSKEIEEELRVSENIINIGFTHDIQKYLAISNLFVFPSFKEGMPVCVIEALAMEVPVVTTNSRGCNDLILNNYNGFLIEDYSNENELTNLLDYILNNKKVLDELIINAKKDRFKYSRKLFVEEQMEEYLKLINEVV